MRGSISSSRGDKPKQRALGSIMAALEVDRFYERLGKLHKHFLKHKYVFPTSFAPVGTSRVSDTGEYGLVTTARCLLRDAASAGVSNVFTLCCSCIN